MRILVHEFVSGGGLAGRPVPASLAREGAAMRDALVADLAALERHRIVATADPRFPLRRPGVEVVTHSRGRGTLDRLIASADAVWLVAPETDRAHELLAARVEAAGTALLGSGSTAIRRAADKAAVARLLRRHKVSHPETRVLRPRVNRLDAVRTLGYPVVVKPARGAGCGGVGLARNARELRDAVDLARRADGRGPLLVQRFVPGVAASVSLVADGRRAVVLAVNAQAVRPARPFVYRGGHTPLRHPLAVLAAETALRACRAVPGLRGWVGVDLVLTDSETVVIEINPRLTTAYLGVRRSLGVNVVELVLAACAGRLPVPPRSRRTVRFTTGGRVTAIAGASA
jgi:predicted ATP-grasp superfamily ATP-dependent carboligase